MKIFLLIFTLTTSNGAESYALGPYSNYAECEKVMKSQRGEIPRQWPINEIGMACVPVTVATKYRT